MTEERPSLHFLVRGPPGAGKSTLLSALFARGDFRRSSGDGLERIDVSKGDSDDPSNFSALSSLLPLADGVVYRFVATNGSEGDYEESKEASAVILVVDKDGLDCQISRQQSFVQAVKDIKAAKESEIAEIPLIIIVNKVDDADDDDVMRKVNEYRQFVLDYLSKEKLQQGLVEVVAMSLLNTYLYRAFLLKNNFDLLEEKDIVRISSLELGGQGKEAAKSRDNYKNLEEEIATRLSTGNATGRWKSHCGLSGFVDSFTKLVLSEVSFFPLLQRRLHQLLESLPKPTIFCQLRSNKARNVTSYPSPYRAANISNDSASISSRIPQMLLGFSNNPLFSPGRESYALKLKTSSPQNQKRPRETPPQQSIETGPSNQSPNDISQPNKTPVLDRNMKTIIHLHNQFDNIVAAWNKNHEEGMLSKVIEDFRAKIKPQCNELFQKNFSCYVKSLTIQNGILGNVSRDMSQNCLDLIDMHENIDSAGMKTAECWNRARTKSTVMLLELLWNRELNKGFFDSSFKEMSREEIRCRVLTTLEILNVACNYASSRSGMINQLIKALLVPFITKIPDFVAILPLSSSHFKRDRDSTSQENSIIVIDIDAESGGGGSLNNGKDSTTCNSNQSSQDKMPNEDDSIAIVLVHIERCVLGMVLGDQEGDDYDGMLSAAEEELIYSLVARKISVRSELMGYTTCLREKLWSFSDITQRTVYESLKEKYFSLFFPVIHCAIPEIDVAWGRALPSDHDYSCISECPYLESERELILRALLKTRAADAKQASRSNSVVSDHSSATMKSRVNSISSAISECAESRSIVLKDAPNEEVDETPSKRKRLNEDGAVAAVPEEKRQETPSVAKSTRSNASRVKASPARRRIVRKHGEC